MAKLNFDDTLRQVSQPILLPLVKILASFKIHPNVITLICFAGFVISSYFIACGNFLIAGLLLIIFAPLDAIDGALARFSNQVTKFGAFLDSTLDRYGEILIFLAFSYYFLTQNSPWNSLLSFLGITGSLMVSYARARAEGAGFECKIGFFTRFERLFLLILALLFDFCTLFLVIISIFTHLTALQRILYVYKQYKKRGK